MGKCQVSYGNIEIAKLRLGQASNIFLLENVFFYHTLHESNPKKSKLPIHEYFEEKSPKK